METETLHRYFDGEITEEEGRRIAEWAESDARNMECLLTERKLYDLLLFADEQSSRRGRKRFLFLCPLIAICALAPLFFLQPPIAPEPPVTQPRELTDTFPAADSTYVRNLPDESSF